MKIFYSDRAIKQVSSITKSDPKRTELLLRAIEAYAENPAGTFNVKKLKGKMESFLRLRVGNYRILFEVEGSEMRIYEIKHRQGVYK